MEPLDIRTPREIFENIVDFNHKRAARGSAIKPAHLAAAVILIVIVFLAFTPGNFLNQSVSNLTQTTTTSVNTNENLCSVTKPMQLTAFNSLSGAALNAPQVELRNGASPHTLIQNASASSSGVVTTGSSYTTGTPLKIQTYAASTVRQYINFVVPAMTCGDTSTNNVVAIYAVVLGAWTNLVTGSGGTTFTDAFVYLIDQFTGNEVDITFTMAETTANAGYRTSYDYVNGVWMQYVVTMSTAGTSLEVNGFGKSAIKGSTTYYFASCADGLTGTGFGKTGGTGAFTAQVSGNRQDSGGGLVSSNCVGSLTSQTVGTTAYGGSAAVTFNIGIGSLTAQSTQDIDIDVRRNSDIQNYIDKNSYGANTVAVGSTFDITFLNG